MSQPPDLDILEIGDLTKDRFRGIFRLSYAGDAYIELQTSVQVCFLFPLCCKFLHALTVIWLWAQANPLSNSKPGLDILPSPSVLFAAQPLVVPMSLRLSDLKLKAIIVLVISRQKGITLVFKNDPLESVKVSSSFDSVGVIQGYIQRQIESQLREVFRSDLPSIIHRLSQRWLSETSSSSNAFNPKAKIHTQTAFEHPGSHAMLSRSLGGKPVKPRMQQRSASYPRLPSEVAEESVSESIATYDPTYGMRSGHSNEAAPQHKALVGHMNGLWSSTSTDRGLGHAVVEPRVDAEDAATSIAEADDDGWLSSPSSQSQWSAPTGDPSSPSYDSHLSGGRPRIFHSHSQASLPSRYPRSVSLDAASMNSARMSEPQTPRRGISRGNSSLAGRPSSSLYTSSPSSLFLSRPASSSFASLSSAPSAAGGLGPVPECDSVAEDDHPPEASTSSSPLREDPALPSSAPHRQPSPPPLLPAADSSMHARNLLFAEEDEDGDSQDRPRIQLTPARNDSCAHIRTLSNSFQTLSPFTLPLENFTARSVPRLQQINDRTSSSSPSSEKPARGRRRRVFRIGKAAADAAKAEQDKQQEARSQHGSARSAGSLHRRCSEWDAGSDSGSDWSDYFPRQSAARSSPQAIS